ncbi:MAG TPA: DUF2254 domain-containing protein [Acetobacteraceae bacterium]|jgi:uncharacterized membrane protein|nr:DUF2254 domain-containing protein [Acetobacteraceae bacterium]
MHWNQWYRLKSYFRSALWIVPFFALVLENIAIRLVFGLHERLGWVPWFGATPGGTSEALNTVETLTISFIVFTFGSLLVAIQVASGQLTPRIIATTLLRNNVIRFTVGLFIFTMLFAAGTGVRLDSTVTHPAVAIAWALGVVSIAAFLFLIDYTARLLRPVSILWRIGEQGIKVVESVFPNLVEAPRPARTPTVPGAATRVVEHDGTSAIVLAVNVDSLIALARRAEGVIAFVPRVGDFVASGEPLYRLYGNAAQIDDRKLRAQVAFGPERTIEQDSTFAFRVIVDIGIKALSPAINDPSTAVMAIDQLHRLLGNVGRRHLHEDALLDANGALRLIFQTPGWDDFVQLAVSEIRLYGAGNFQVSRRLRAMIENLLESLPENRRPALRRELDLLDRALPKLHEFPEDLDLARKADFQGLGGSSKR